MIRDVISYQTGRTAVAVNVAVAGAGLRGK